MTDDHTHAAGPERQQPNAFDTLRPGQTFTTANLTVTLDAMKAFAAQFDPQPMHLDEDAARASFFGELIGSGWHTAALTMKLVVEARLLGPTPLVGVSVDHMRFKHPLRPNDRIHAVIEVTNKRPSTSPDRGYASLKVTTMTDNDTVLMTQQWTILVPRCDTRDTA